MISLPNEHVKVRSRSAEPPVLTYAFLDSASNTTFCSQQLRLTVYGEQTTLLLITLGKQSSVMECRVFKREVFDLNEQKFIKLSTVFSTP